MTPIFENNERTFTKGTREIVTLLAARLAALAIALIVGTTMASAWLSWSIAGLFAITALSLGLLRAKEPTAFVRWLHIGVDIGVVGFLILVTGGFASFASLLFLPIVAVAYLGEDYAHGKSVSRASCVMFLLTGIAALICFPETSGSSVGALVSSALLLGLIWGMDLAARRIRILFETVQTTAATSLSQVYSLQTKQAEADARIRELEEELELQEVLARKLALDSQPMIAQKLMDDSASILVAKSQVMQKLQSLVVRVAPTDATVLVTGESGTGKEVVARTIHELSQRAKAPFVAVNCGAIPEQLLESELFGHKKGAFTGAVSDATGLFRKASHGTIFLDEIGELPMHMQVKLLRAIQERRVRPVGSDTDIEIDVRIIAATNKDLKQSMREGKFREDLFFRLNVISLCLPPLRERKEDMPELIEKLVKRITGGRQMVTVSPQALNRLLSYSYPGNVRELENLLSRAVVFGGEAILPEHLPELENPSQKEKYVGRSQTEIIELNNVTLPVRLDDILGSLEKRYLLAALDKTSGAKKKAADLLGMNFRSFRYRLQKFDIDQEDSLEQ